MPTMLVGNTVSGHFVIMESEKILWRGRAEDSVLVDPAGLHTGMWLQDRAHVRYYEDDVGEHPYTDARELFRKDHVREQVLTYFVMTVDGGAWSEEVRRLAAEEIEKMLGSPDADLVREYLLDLPIYDVADLSLDFGGAYGDIIIELRRKPVLPQPR